MRTALADLAREVPERGRLEALGVPRRNRTFLWGPPGCGKTSAGEALAAELGVPLVVVRLDAYTGPGLLVAATNHEETLDRGLWRRG